MRHWSSSGITERRRAPLSQAASARKFMHAIDVGSLTLEPQVAAHAEEMFVVLSDPAIYEYENAPPASIEWLRARFTKLEARQSPDGSQHWLNWVIRLPTSELIGYVQATVHADGHAAIAYELCSQYWGRGLAYQAVRAMIGDLVETYRVRRLSAVLRRDNRRSLRFLERLGFVPASPEATAQYGLERGEMLMHRDAGSV
jgi:RimJ/RimL family protein N-acetyltransferase